MRPEIRAIRQWLSQLPTGGTYKDSARSSLAAGHLRGLFVDLR
jgi:hypothetical protein